LNKIRFEIEVALRWNPQKCLKLNFKWKIMLRERESGGKNKKHFWKAFFRHVIHFVLIEAHKGWVGSLMLMFTLRIRSLESPFGDLGIYDAHNDFLFLVKSGSWMEKKIFFSHKVVKGEVFDKIFFIQMHACRLYIFLKQLTTLGQIEIPLLHFIVSIYIYLLKVQVIL